MKRKVTNVRINKIFEIAFISMLSASLCACSFGSIGDNTQPSDPVVEITVNDETANQEDTSANDTPDEVEPEIIPEEPTTVVILGTEYDLSTEILDLSGMTSADVPAVAEAIIQMPELKIVNLVPGANVTEVPAESEEAAEPEVTTEPVETAEPEATADPIEAAEPEVTTDPVEAAEPEATAEPEITADPEATEGTENAGEEEASSLLLSDVVILKEAAPGVHFNYEFDLFGKNISTSDTEVRYVNTQIGNEGEESIRQALTILDECEYFLLDDCGIDNEIMDGIRTAFPNTKVVWRVHVGPKSALTDDPVIRMTHGINDSVTEPLKYCNEVVYMDLGHDTGITDISFIENMPLLECLILSDAQFSDLTPLTHCPNLTWLELIYCGRIEDISVISEMESIKYLNISNTGISDISGIMDMNLDRFCCIGNRVNTEDFEKYKELHPDCMAVSSGNPYGYAWRYDDYGYHYFSYYARMREVFRYTESSPGGFKWPEDEVSDEAAVTE